ncbi:bifunctional metallophosphatase/5'-nucleotidase [Qipengyuania sediminis]|uniref:bifunctional metallophosphatase/5'-nucleotidase n=1 Tax=Qipengyuania sediminis TaxID=1532023 RepID=UPI00105A26DF|nr:bifunctional metallophosphatase/5'-nucleotidase [Qipengyuania sediminis]
MRRAAFLLLAPVLAGCATTRPVAEAVRPVEVQILAINDFHGALEPPQLAVVAGGEPGAERRVPAGGAAHLASAISALRQGRANSITVAAGDLTGGSPFASSQFLDEPAIHALNLIGLELNAVGNHEFDRGTAELRRLQNGGCVQNTALKPCRVDADFPGARFRYLAANVKTADGKTLFPATAMKSFGQGADRVEIGFIGLTLEGTDALVAPDAIRDVAFADEAETINTLVPELRRQGADAVVVLIHQGVYTEGRYNDKACPGLSGALLPILGKLDPGVDVVVSGHTHQAYVCDYGQADPARPLLLTSAGSRGMLVTDITLSIDPRRGRVVARRADNTIVQSLPYDGPGGVLPIDPGFTAYPADPAVQALVARYVAAAEPIARRVVGRIGGPLQRARNASGETQLGSLVADAQAAATAAEIAFMNSFGLRADLVPGSGGTVTFGQLYSVQPFGNVLQVKGLTGAQLRALLEQQFASGSNTVERPNMLQVSRGFSYTYDLTRPAGQRIVSMTLNGSAIEDSRVYRVGLSNFLAAGGDNFTVFTAGRDLPGGGQEDVAALEAYVVKAGTIAPPPLGRIIRLDAPAAPPPED